MFTSFKPRLRAWVARYLASANLGGFAVAWALALAHDGDMLAASAGYAPLRILPEAGWRVLMCALAAAQIGPALLALTGRTLPHLHAWQVIWTVIGAIIWLGIGYQLGQFPVISGGPGTYFWIGCIHCIRLLCDEWSREE